MGSEKTVCLALCSQHALKKKTPCLIGQIKFSAHWLAVVTDHGDTPSDIPGGHCWQREIKRGTKAGDVSDPSRKRINNKQYHWLCPLLAKLFAPFMKHNTTISGEIQPALLGWRLLRLWGKICCSSSRCPPVHVIPNQMLISLIDEGVAFANRPSVCAPYLCSEHASSRWGGFVFHTDWAVYAATLFRPHLVLSTPLTKRQEISSKQRPEEKSVRRFRGGQQRTRSYLHIMQHPLHHDASVTECGASGCVTRETAARMMQWCHNKKENAGE